MLKRFSLPYDRFRTLILVVVSALTGVQTVLIPLFVSYDSLYTFWFLVSLGLFSIVFIIIAIVRRTVGEKFALSFFWAVLGISVVLGLTIVPPSLGQLSAFQFLTLAIAATATLRLTPALYFSASGLALGVAVLSIRSVESLPAILVFAWVVALSVYIVAMLRSYLDAERDGAVALSQADELTGAQNRRGMDVLVPILDDLAERAERHLGCLTLDLDRFKSINDSFGHRRGDAVLREVVAAISLTTRRSDVLVRTGGEEFALFTIVSNPEQLLTVGETVRKAVEAHCSDVGLTVSIGGSLGTAQSPEELQTLLEAADRRMYEAKNAGRNTVIVS
jgi:diguanylate cyclase (GGDEF)-like protein